MLFLALVPAVAIWALFMDLLTTSVDVLRHSTKASSDSMADGVQRLMMARPGPTMELWSMDAKYIWEKENLGGPFCSCVSVYSNAIVLPINGQTPRFGGFL